MSVTRRSFIQGIFATAAATQIGAGSLISLDETPEAPVKIGEILWDVEFVPERTCYLHSGETKIGKHEFLVQEYSDNTHLNEEEKLRMSQYLLEFVLESNG